MSIERAIAHEPFILFEGAVIERLRRNPNVHLDPHVLHAGLIYDRDGRAALESVYRSYLDVGRRHDLPMVALTPTWRANPEKLSRTEFGDVHAVNRDGFRFLAAIRDTYGDYARKIWIGGLMGCRGDAYKPREALSRDEARRFHAPQARALAEVGADLIMGATLPAFSEALGMAEALAEAGLPYVISYVVRPTGTLLDGMPLYEAIAAIDARVHPPPAGYMINCVHPSVFEEALHHERDRSGQLCDRILGLQANTSPKPPEELDNATDLECQDPDTFAEAMVRAYKRYHIVALGGCCGTDERHIARIAERIAQPVPSVCLD